MNRYKAEEARKRREARSGLSEEEVQRLDREEAIEAEVRELSRKIHAERFEEETDLLLDDHVDYANRQKGINPMDDKYNRNTNQKHAQEGVAPLSDAGLPVDDTSWEIAYAESEAVIRGRK